MSIPEFVQLFWKYKKINKLALDQIYVVSWTKGLRNMGQTTNNVARKPKCWQAQHLPYTVDVSSAFQSNSYAEKACVTLATSGCGTRVWWD